MSALRSRDAATIEAVVGLEGIATPTPSRRSHGRASGKPPNGHAANYGAVSRAFDDHVRRLVLVALTIGVAVIIATGRSSTSCRHPVRRRPLSAHDHVPFLDAYDREGTLGAATPTDGRVARAGASV